MTDAARTVTVMRDVPTRTRPDGSVVEIPLSHCTHCGAELGAGRVTLGWLSCSCRGGNGHRLSYCWACRQTSYLPPHDDSIRFQQVGSDYFGG